MSHETEERELNDGHDCAMSAVAAHREALANLTPAERLNWWIGFISAAMGTALASVGEATMRMHRRAPRLSRDPSP